MKYFSCEGSGEISASKLIYNGPCFLTSLMVYGDGVNDADGIVYNNTTAVGDVAAKITVDAPLSYGGRDYRRPRWCPNGLFAELSGTGVSAIVEWMRA